MREALLILTTLNICSFAWSVFGVFRKEKSKDQFKYNVLVVVSLFTYFSVFISLYEHSPIETYYLLASFLFQLFSLLLFWWSVLTVKKNTLSLAFSKDTPQQLIQSGPFKYIRHPFYLSYLNCYFVVVVTTHTWHLTLCFILILLIYVIAMHLEEKKFKESPLHKEYLEYKSTTGKLVPNFLKLKVSPSADKKAEIS